MCVGGLGRRGAMVCIFAAGCSLWGECIEGGGGMRTKGRGGVQMEGRGLSIKSRGCESGQMSSQSQARCSMEWQGNHMALSGIFDIHYSICPQWVHFSLRVLFPITHVQSTHVQFMWWGSFSYVQISLAISYVQWYALVIRVTSNIHIFCGNLERDFAFGTVD